MTAVFSWPGGQIPVPDKSAPAKVAWAEVPAFSLKPGSITVLQGVSGVGKSHFLSQLAGVAEVPADLRNHKEAKSALAALVRPSGAICWIPQNPPLREKLTVELEVKTLWTALGVPWDEKRFRRLLKLVGLEGREAQKISELSGGQRKRLTLLQRLAVPTPYVFLDEPEAGLDEITFREMFADILTLLKETGTPALLIVSHKSNLVCEVAKKFALDYREVELKKTLTPVTPTESPISPPQPKEVFRSPVGAFWENLVAHDFTTGAVWIMHLGIPAVMVAMIALCHIKSHSDTWAKTFFFLNVTALWVGVQGGMYLFNRHLPTWREDEAWARLAFPENCAHARHRARIFGLALSLIVVGAAAWLAIDLLAGVLFWLKPAPQEDWTPGKGLIPATAGMLAYGYTWGLLLPSAIAHIQSKFIQNRANSMLSEIAAPALMLMHLLLSPAYLLGDSSSTGEAGVCGNALVDALVRFNPVVMISHYTESWAGLGNSPHFHPLFVWPLTLLLLLYITSYNAIGAKELRA